MDVERHKEQGDETAKPRFVWDLERAHTKAPSKQAKPKPVRPSRVHGARRRRALLSAFVAAVVFAGGAFTVVELSGHGDAAKTGGTQAAELGGAEFPATIASFPGMDSRSTPAYVTPTRHASASPSPSHHTTTAAVPSTAPATYVAPVEVTTSTAPATATSPRTSAAAAQPVTTPSMPSVVEAFSDQWGQCALLNGTCSVSLPSVVAIGANGRFNYGTFGNSTACTDGVFGNPNASGQVACYSEPTPTASSDVWTQCASENGTCRFSGVMTVAFGANGAYHYATLGSGGTACTDAVFGDPDYGAVKTCYMMAPPPQFTHWDLCATSGGTCKFSGTEEVAYGSNGHYVYGSYTNGTACTSSAIGNPDASGTEHCYVQNYYFY